MEWLDRMQRAVNPLPERLAFFWHRHWAVSRDDGWSRRVGRQVPRPAAALRRLRRPTRTLTLPHARVRDDDADAAMSMYLNLNQNTKTKPNENYAREIMELFCLGPKGPDGTTNYTPDRRRRAHARVHRLGSRARADDARRPGLREDHVQPEPASTSTAKTFLGQTDRRRSPARRLDQRDEPALGPAAVTRPSTSCSRTANHAQFLIRKLWAEFIAEPDPAGHARRARVAAYRGQRLPAQAAASAGSSRTR